MTDNALYPALLRAQQSMGKVKKDAKNPAFRSNYATLSSILDTIEGPLWDNGLLVLQQFQYDRIGLDGSAGEGTPILITRLVHAASGESIESVVTVASKDPHDPQKVGSAITYYRRYSLLALLGLAPEDDDGNAAAQPPTPRQTNAPRPVQRAQQGPPPIPAAPLSEAQDKMIAEIRDEAEAGLSYAGAGKKIREMEADATPGQWVTIKQRFVGIRRDFYPESIKKQEAAQ